MSTLITIQFDTQENIYCKRNHFLFILKNKDSTATTVINPIHENTEDSQSKCCQNENVQVDTILVFDKIKLSPVDIIPVGNVKDEDIIRIGVTTNQDDNKRNAVEEEIPDG